MLYELIELLSTRSPFFIGLLLEHLALSAVVVLIAAVIGLVIGILISSYPMSRKPTLSVINLIYTIPSIALLGFLIPLSGVGNTTAAIALTVYALLPMVRSTYTGIESIDPLILETARGMGSTRMQLLLRIKLPLAMPFILSALRNMTTMTIALAGIASFIGAGGLGVAIYRGIATNNPPMIVLGSVLIALLATGADKLLAMAERLVEKKETKAKVRIRALWIGIALSLALPATLVLWQHSTSKGRQGVVKVATKLGAEQYIIGEMLKLLIEQHTAMQVILTPGIGGGTSNIHPAMLNAETDLYPEYTGTAWSVALKRSEPYTEEWQDTLKTYYREHFDMEWVGMYGFNNTYALAVHKNLAEQHKLVNASDLAPWAHKLCFGAEYDFFERSDGYQAFCNTYGYTFGTVLDMDIALKYQALASGRIDALNVFTTDGLISVSPLQVLEDDKGFFPSYYCGTVVRKKILEQYPQLKEVLMKLDGMIHNQDMQRLNYQVEALRQDPAKVARIYLEEKGLVDPE